MTLDALSIALDEETRIGEARRQAAQLAARLGLDDERRGRIALVVTEAASNVIHHARAGRLLLSGVEASGHAGVQMVCADGGPGMDVDACLRDGFSTAGSRGAGLGAIARLSDVFDAWSAPGKGAVVLSRIFARTPPRPAVETGELVVPKPGEAASGDGCAVLCFGDRVAACVADGLGHGPEAARAARAALHVFRELAASHGPAEILAAAHRELHGTRGAAVAAFVLDRAAATVVGASVGNVSAAVVTAEETRRAVAQNGTVGDVLPGRILETTYRWPRGATFLAHSDGLSSHWDVGKYPGVLAFHPALLAGLLLRDHDRGRDDATVLCLREAPRG